MVAITTAKVSNTVKESVWGPIYTTTANKGQRVLNDAAKSGHKVPLVYGYNTTPDHNNRQCIDFMHYGDTKIRKWLEDYLIKNHKTLGVEAIISNRRCMGFPSNETKNTTPYWNGPEGEWRDYHGPNPHTDHVHVQFNTNKIKTAPKTYTVKKGDTLTSIAHDHHTTVDKLVKINNLHHPNVINVGDKIKLS